ncbi:hypothetical protein [Providencia sp.]|uniref:hypothetical protein n=1 Tax=Providencia sp. TaxID=589 RepID=UPI003F9BA485
MKNMTIGTLLLSLYSPIVLCYDGLSISGLRDGTRLDSANKPYRVVYEWYGVSSNGLPLVEMTPSVAENVAKLGGVNRCTVSFALSSNGSYSSADPVLVSKPAGMTSQFIDYLSGIRRTNYSFDRNTDCITAVNQLGVTYGFFSSDVKNEMNNGGTIGGNSCIEVDNLLVESEKQWAETLRGCLNGAPIKPVSCTIDSPMVLDYGIIRNSELNASRLDKTINISCLDAQNTVLFAVNPTPVEMSSKLSVKPELCIGTSCDTMKTVTFKGSTSLNLRTTLHSDDKNPPEAGVYQAYIILSAQYY